jgi:serine/threonine protein kinase/Tol biopolymer transport system component
MNAISERLAAALADRYRIVRLVGEGGMATVYLARDLKHDRLVALKVLKPELGAVLGVDRFLSEIKVTANLQHPNLLPLFDSGEAEGLLFYVMPFVEGESLRARIDREKQLSIDEAVRIAVAVGSALDYAHRHGVIHRDLKPENILLQDGQPVVADFGIALAVSNAGGARVTQTGLSLGTPQYMSPEQASGDRAIDARSDIYSLAALTFEMIAGEAPHNGPTAQAIIAKLMTVDPPPLSSLRKTTPIHVEAAVTKALAKLPADRFASARDFVDAVEGRGLTAAMMAVAGMRQAPRATAPLWRQPAVVGLATAFVAATSFGAAQWNAAHRTSDPAVVRFHIEMPTTVLGSNTAAGRNLTISPDGRAIVYSRSSEDGVARLYVRQLADAEETILPGSDGAQQPTFSPDGNWLAYLVSDKLWKMPFPNGTPIPIGAVGVSPVGLTWSPDGRIYIGGTAALLAMNASSGEIQIAARSDSAAGELYMNNPLALPDGDHVLLCIQSTGGLTVSKLAVYSRKSQRLTRVDLVCAHPLGVVDDQLVYATPAGVVSLAGIDVDGARVTSSPTVLGINVIARISGAADAALSPSGTFVYSSASPEGQLGWADARGNFAPLLTEQRAYAFPRLSPDGKRIAVSIGAGSRSDVWSFEPISSTLTKITSAGTQNDRPEWSPDGRRIVYRTDRTGRSAIWWQPVDLSGPAEVIQGSDAHDFYEGVFSSDGRYFVYQVDDATAVQADVMYRRVAGDTSSAAIISTGASEAQARVSPDGRWVAFVTDAPGATQVSVAPMGGGARVQVSQASGGEPVWSRDGRRLFYRDGRSFVSARVRTDGRFAVESREVLFPDQFAVATAPHANFDVSLDGTRFLVIKSVERPQLNVVFGWLGELRARPAARR